MEVRLRQLSWKHPNNQNTITLYTSKVAHKGCFPIAGLAMPGNAWWMKRCPLYIKHHGGIALPQPVHKASAPVSSFTPPRHQPGVTTITRPVRRYITTPRLSIPHPHTPTPALPTPNQITTLWPSSPRTPRQMTVADEIGQSLPGPNQCPPLPPPHAPPPPWSPSWQRFTTSLLCDSRLTFSRLISLPAPRLVLLPQMHYKISEHVTRVICPAVCYSPPPWYSALCLPPTPVIITGSS